MNGESLSPARLLLAGQPAPGTSVSRLPLLLELALAFTVRFGFSRLGSTLQQKYLAALPCLLSKCYRVYSSPTAEALGAL